MAEEEVEEAAAAALRRLVGQIQELCDLYGSPPFFSLHQFQPTLDPRWYSSDFKSNSSTKNHLPLQMDSESESRANSKSSIFMLEGGEEEDISNTTICKRLRRNKESESNFQMAIQSELMEAEIWKKLPEDLFEPVLARLSVPAIFRFHSVCGQWRGILTSKTFHEQFLRVPKSYPWFYTVTHEDPTHGAMYDPSAQKWHRPTIPFLTENGNQNKIRSGSGIVFPVASAGGLVCFLDLSHTHIYACNPLTSSYRELPPTNVPFWSRVSVVMVNSSTGYKIMWLGCSGKYEIYDSSMNKWSRPVPVPPSITVPLSLNFRSKAVSIGTTLYFMRGQPDGILTYEMSTGTWKQYAIPLPMSFTDCTLAESQGRVLLVGLLTKNCANCVGVWELQRMTLLWKEVDRMPSELCLEFYGNSLRMSCMGNHGGLVFLSLRSRQVNRLLCYVAAMREWRKVPECVTGLSSQTDKGSWISCGTAFDPCPGAMA
ncbi:F-box family protein [Rhynchospora pubera]|uniref:F-box family protein n=1 Tax=Rhynchospora pubera TaxID=906938 RepID=A0AAV8G430_9POAL|nr:F-box family protein [Rhynchospora pubera]